MPLLRIVLAAALLAALLGGCGGGGDAGTGADAVVGEAGGTSVDWPRWGNDAGNGHFARLDQIHRGNVRQLRLAWSRPGPRRQVGWETFPIVVDGTMYFDTGTDQVFAVDATSGRQRWSYTPAVDLLAAPGVRPPTPVSRGVTYGTGRIYVVSGDARLIALDAKSGNLIWESKAVGDGIHMLMNSPGTFLRGEIVVGGPAGAAGLRGFVAAYRAGDGRPLWRTQMVPPRGAGSRRGPSSGGGNVWMPPTIEPRSGTVYVATGNPSPGFDNSARRGCNPMANALVALDGASGEVLWSRTLVCEDSWDYDTVQSPLIFADEDGAGTGEEAAVGAASKAGFYAVFDAESGKPVARTPYLTRYSRPHLRPTRKGVVACPGIYGGIEYGPPAYSPREGLVYQPGNQMCMRYRLAPRTHLFLAGEDDLGGTATQVGRATGVLAAFEPRSGTVRWKRELPAPANGGALATAGGLVFVGEDDGWLRAFDSSDGAELWHYRLGLRVGSAPIAYEVDGVEYVAIAAGGSLVEARGTAPSGRPRLFVFSLPR